jgi:hypothetical protein
VTKVLTELRAELAAAIQAHATILSTLGVSGDSVVKQIHRMHEEIIREILYCHQYSKLDLYLDTDRTDAGLQHIPPGALDAKAIETGWASINGKAGAIVGRRNDLAAFAQKFHADRGYSDIDCLIEETKAPDGTLPPAAIGLRERQRGGDDTAAAAAVLFHHPNIKNAELALAVPSKRTNTAKPNSLAERGRLLHQRVNDRHPNFPTNYSSR